MSSRVLKSTGPIVWAVHPHLLEVPASRSEEEKDQEKPIDAAEAAEDVRRLAGSVLEEARAEADRLRAEARAEIAAWMEEAREQIRREREAELERAKAEGKRAGWEEGRRAAESAFAQRFRELEERRRELEEWRARFAAITEEHVAEVAIAVAEKVVRRTVETDRDWLAGVVSEAVRSLLPAEDVAVHVHPSDVEEIRGAISAEVKVIPDPDLAPGDARVRSAKGEVDARVEVALEEAAKLIRATAKEAG
ncbi:MAG: FliH/SctL family protein [Alicyclobacillaceae bacterium]|nr:FliH/SctL family protein [Alicyclobacillaceae bacterium]